MDAAIRSFDTTAQEHRPPSHNGSPKWRLQPKSSAEAEVCPSGPWSIHPWPCDWVFRLLASGYSAQGSRWGPGRGPRRYVPAVNTTPPALREHDILPLLRPGPTASYGSSAISSRKARPTRSRWRSRSLATRRAPTCSSSSTRPTTRSAPSANAGTHCSRSPSMQMRDALGLSHTTGYRVGTGGARSGGGRTAKLVAAAQIRLPQSHRNGPSVAVASHRRGPLACLDPFRSVHSSLRVS